LRGRGVSVSLWLHVSSPIACDCSDHGAMTLWCFAGPRLWSTLFRVCLLPARPRWLPHLRQAFDSSFYAPYVGKICEFVQKAAPSLTTPAELYTAIAAGLVKHAPSDKDKYTFLNEGWKVRTFPVCAGSGMSWSRFRVAVWVSLSLCRAVCVGPDRGCCGVQAVKKVESPEVYSSCVAVFLELVLRWYSDRELSVILKDFVAYMKRVVRDPSCASCLVVPSSPLLPLCWASVGELSSCSLVWGLGCGLYVRASPASSCCLQCSRPRCGFFVCAQLEAVYPKECYHTWKLP
jgi:hypothetical protein